MDCRIGLVCGHRSADIERGLGTSVVSCAYHSTVVGLGLPESPLVGIQRPVDVWYSLTTSVVAYTFLSQCCSWTACIDCGLCTLMSRHHVCIARISLGLQTTVKQHEVFPTPITFGLHNIQSTWVWPSHIVFGLHTTVSSYRKLTSCISFVIYVSVRRCHTSIDRIFIYLGTMVN